MKNNSIRNILAEIRQLKMDADWNSNRAAELFQRARAHEATAEKLRDQIRKLSDQPADLAAAAEAQREHDEEQQRETADAMRSNEVER
jgi:fatty acid-binding protein DegV